MRFRSPVTRKLALFIAAIGVLAASYDYCARNVSKLNNFRINEEHCARLAADFIQLRDVPRHARLTTRSADDVGTVVEKAAADARLARDRILRIDPQPAKRLDRSDYLEQGTELELRGATLRQIVDLVFNLVHDDGELAINTLRLRLPHDIDKETGDELWLADAVLTQRVYAPAVRGSK